MTSIQIQNEPSLHELLQTVNQLNLPDLEQFVHQVVELQARRRTHVLNRKESELLLKINQSVSPVLQARCDELIARRRAENLTSAEHKELIKLTDRFNELNVKRLEYLTELANIRKVPFITLIKDLEIKELDVV